MEGGTVEYARKGPKSPEKGCFSACFRTFWDHFDQISYWKQLQGGLRPPDLPETARMTLFSPNGPFPPNRAFWSDPHCFTMQMLIFVLDFPETCSFHDQTSISSQTGQNDSILVGLSRGCP